MTFDAWLGLPTLKKQTPGQGLDQVHQAMPWSHTPRSHREVIARHQAGYDAGVADGSILPFVYPYVSLAGAVALSFFLFVPPRSVFHNIYTRWAVFLFVAWWHSIYIRHSKGLNPSSSFGIGIILAFATLWSAVLLIFDDKKARAKRLDRHENANGQPLQPSSSKPNHSGQFQQDKRNDSSIPAEQDLDKHFPLPTDHKYYWQPYPLTPFSSRLDWVLDLWTNFRGIGFDFKPPGLPSFPVDVQADLYPHRQPIDEPISRTGLERRDTRRPLLSRHLWMLVKGYLACDLLVVMIHHDPYFWGVMDAPPPAYLPSWIKESPHIWLKGYRLTVGMSMIWICLRTIYSMAPVLFVGLLGPKWLGVRGEPWLYHDHYGSYSNVFRRGLAGWWGGWWHQIFRAAFQAAGNWATGLLGIQHDSYLGKYVSVWLAFILSGTLHACGSATQMGPTNPLTGPFAFFCLQPVGIMAEMAFKTALKRYGISKSIPTTLQYVTNFVWVHTWFLLTAPLLVGDMAKGGLWMVEPVPFSPLRALGFGVNGDGFSCWEGPSFRWHRGAKWWESGMAF